MNHRDIAYKAIEILKNLTGVSRLVLYGSVVNGNSSEDSDIDIAVILLNEMRMVSCDLEGIPFCTTVEIRNVVEHIEKEYKVRIQAPIYFESQYKKGIELSGRKPQSDLLHLVGKEFVVI